MGAAMPWFKVHAGWSSHPKVVDLCAELGDARADGWVARLWDYCAMQKGDGRFSGPNALEMAVRYDGPRGTLAAAMRKAGLLDADGDALVVHDWATEQKAVAEKFARERMRYARSAYPQLFPEEVIAEPVIVPRFRIRLKTPEERAKAEAEERIRIEELRKRRENERTLRDEMRAAKVAASRVYFIQQNGGERLVKIGTTARAVDVRLKELQASNSQPLVIRASALGGRAQESHLHCRFASLRVVGEWFRPDAALEDYMTHVATRGGL